jgi:beta-lactam-binding protein with PASTA domain
MLMAHICKWHISRGWITGKHDGNWSWTVRLGLRAGIYLTFATATAFGQSVAARVVPVVVPNVVGRTYEQAQTILEKLGLVVVPAGRLEDAAQAGTVILQNPAARRPVARGSRISLTVSAGRITPGLRMPNLFDRTIPAAQKLLAPLNLQIQVSAARPSVLPTGTIIQQQPPAGGELPQNRIVMVVLAQPVATEVRVPLVVGRPLEQAIQIISNSGLTTGRLARQANASPAGSVFAQYPQAGQIAEPRSPVDLSVSTGPVPPPPPNFITTPDLRGQDVNTARQVLARLRLRLGQTAVQVDLSPSGQVIQQSPPARTPVLPGTSVDVVISRGGIAVPDLLGRTQTDAAGVLSGVGLSIGDVRTTSSPEPAGSIFDENPPPGTVVAGGTAVALSVSTGPPSPPTVAVPDVVGKQEQDATAALEAAGFKTGVISREPSSEPELTVIAQDPRPGTLAAPGKAVRLVISKTGVPVPPIAVPDVTGLPAGRAKEILASSQLDAITVANTGAGADDQWVVSGQSPSAHSWVQAGTIILLTLRAPVGLPVGWTFGGAGALVILSAAAYGLGRKRGAQLPSRFNTSHIIVTPHKDWGGPRVSNADSNTMDQPLQIAGRRDPGRQTIRISNHRDE